MEYADIKPGVTGHREQVVTGEMTAASMVSGSLPVFSTPALLAFIEGTAWGSVHPLLDEGMDTVGTRVELEHLAAAPVGAEVVCDTTLVAVDRRLLVFEATVRWGDVLIGRCRHERFIIDQESFLGKLRG